MSFSRSPSNSSRTRMGKQFWRKPISVSWRSADGAPAGIKITRGARSVRSVARRPVTKPSVSLQTLAKTTRSYRRGCFENVPNTALKNGNFGRALPARPRQSTKTVERVDALLVGVVQAGPGVESNKRLTMDRTIRAYLESRVSRKYSLRDARRGSTLSAERVEETR